MFEVYQDKRGEYRWRYRDMNGKILFACTEGYKNAADRDQSLNRAKGSADAPIKAV